MICFNDTLKKCLILNIIHPYRKYLVQYIGIKSLLDVGCGIGVSTSWFALHGLDYVQCVEGSHDAVEKSLLPGLKDTGKVLNTTTLEMVEHDFSR